MAFISTNDPNQQPGRITPTSLDNVTWPGSSDSLSYRSAPILKFRDWMGPGAVSRDFRIPDTRIAVTFVKLGRHKTWQKLFQQVGTPGVTGSWSKSHTTGASVSTSEQTAWSRTLGLSAGFTFSAFSASASAEWSKSGSVTTSVDVRNESTTTWSPSWNSEVPSVYVGQQLHEQYFIDHIRFNFWGYTDLKQITDQMVADCKNWAATGSGKLPDRVKPQFWTDGVFTNRTENFAVEVFPPGQAKASSDDAGGAGFAAQAPTPLFSEDDAPDR
jgi:hypothetical protein